MSTATMRRPRATEAPAVEPTAGAEATSPQEAPPAAPQFRKGDRVWFWTEGGDGPNGLQNWAADVVTPAAGFEDHYQILALVPFGPQFIPIALATSDPKALCISPRE